MTGWIRAGIVFVLAAFVITGAACSSSSNKTSATKTAATKTATKTTATRTTATKTTAATGIYQTPPGGTPASQTPSASAATTLTVTQNASLGEILTDSAGRTLYKYASDQPGTSNCTGTCAQNWPPLTATGTPTAGAGVNGTVGTIQRSDGTTQVTFDGSPLYYFASDTSPGAATGNGVGGFSVVNPM